MMDSLRRDAESAFKAAVLAVQPATLIPAALRLEHGMIRARGIQGRTIEIPRASGTRLVVALGKAGAALAAAWQGCFPGWAHEMLVLVPHGVQVCPRLEASSPALRGAHPYPDEAGLRSTRQLLSRLEELGRDDTCVVLLSGGASSLLAAPSEDLTLEDVRCTTQTLLEAGVSIEPVNTVRRELLAAAGGGLSRAAAPARTFCLVVSDVLGDPLESIGSGPTVPSSTTPADALTVLDAARVRAQVPPSVVRLLERRARSTSHRHGPPVSREADPAAPTLVIANNLTAVNAATASLVAQGYDVITRPEPLEGEASTRGRELVHAAQRLQPSQPGAIVQGAETTVTVHGSGRGGRNQELALAAAIELHRHPELPPMVLLSAGTDGVDGLSEHAGAIVDATTVSRIEAAGIDATKALADNDSATALAAAGQTLTTGQTGTNVNDVVICLMS